MSKARRLIANPEEIHSCTWRQGEFVFLPRMGSRLGDTLHVMQEHLQQLSLQQTRVQAPILPWCELEQVP